MRSNKFLRVGVGGGGMGERLLESTTGHTFVTGMYLIIHGALLYMYELKFGSGYFPKACKILHT